MFSEHDVITLIKQNGEKIENVRANVQPDMIFISDAMLPIEEDDVFERKLRNGLIERYVVLDRGYWDTGNMPAHYQCKVKKEINVQRQKQPSMIVYNLYGHNARVNNHSIDNSVSVIDINPDEVFDKLEYAINANNSNNDKLIACISEMRTSVGKPIFLEKFQDFVSLGANLMTIIGPYLPALSQMIKQ